MFWKTSYLEEKKRAEEWEKRYNGLLQHCLLMEGMMDIMRENRDKAILIITDLNLKNKKLEKEIEELKNKYSVEENK